MGRPRSALTQKKERRHHQAPTGGREGPPPRQAQGPRDPQTPGGSWLRLFLHPTGSVVLNMMVHTHSRLFICTKHFSSKRHPPSQPGGAQLFSTFFPQPCASGVALRSEGTFSTGPQPPPSTNPVNRSTGSRLVAAAWEGHFFTPPLLPPATTLWPLDAQRSTRSD